MASIFRRMNTRRLHNPDIKQLVQALRTDPHSSVNPEDARFEKATQAAIKKLPRRLRSSAISYHGSLCHSHKGLDAYLINDVWSWMRYELEVAVGRFLYPIVMSDILTEEDEFRVRQLEPVVRMFNANWTLAESAAPGKKPIDTGTKWTYQKNGCPACMLTRLGSDRAALFALFACMYGHLHSRSGDRKGASQVRSKRLRFVRYWMKTHPNGNREAEEAYDFGVELKLKRRHIKSSLRGTKYAREGLSQGLVTSRHGHNGQSPVSFNISDPYYPNDRAFIDKHDSKIGPTLPLDPTSRTVIEGWDRNATRTNRQQSKINVQPPTPRTPIPCMPFTQEKPPQTPHRHDSMLGATSTIQPRPASSIYSVQSFSVATLQPARPASYAYSLNRPNSCSTVAPSILSYNDPTKPSKPRGYDPLETVDEWVDRCLAPTKGLRLQDRDFKEAEHDRRNTYVTKYRNPQLFNPRANRREAVLLEGDFRNGVVQHEGEVLPKPSRCSMYSAFGEEGRDGEEFEVVDETPPPSPIMETYDEGIVGKWAVESRPET